MNKQLQEQLRQLPSMDELLDSKAGEELSDRFGRSLLKSILQEYLNDLRTSLRKSYRKESSPPDHSKNGTTNPEHIMNSVTDRLEGLFQPSLHRVVNGTGVVLHTGLGRAVLPEAVLNRFQDIHEGYSLLEVDAETNERNQRERACVDLLRRLTGAEHATIVNNNAAAVFLMLITFARGKDVIISRGELVEIGGSFRIPDVMEQSGTELVEVGTTNKTSADDYRNAITENTAALMNVHSSNYRIVGFSDNVDTETLSGIADDHDLHLFEDLGSGAFIDFAQYGFHKEPLAKNRLEAGADLVCFSGDKLLGGPQAGVIAGRKSLVKRVRNHPLFRAVRPDKLTLTALEATLQLYLSDSATEEIPALRMITMDPEEIHQRAEKLMEQIDSIPEITTEIREGTSRVGGGSLPDEALPTSLVQIESDSLEPEELAYRLRTGDPSVFGRVQDGSLFLDPRTFVEGDVQRIRSALKHANPAE